MKFETNCHGLAAVISEYIDGELSPELCAELEQHMRECQNCTIVINTLRKTIDLVQKSDPGECLPDEVKTRLYRRLNLDEYLIN